jgi:D-alanine-D-alanine ligase
MLRRYHPLWMSIHFTHPDELTPEAEEACGRLADAGIPLGSQTVLLAGVNDNVETMKQLMHGLLRFRVKPYYLYQCDPILGSAHFRTSVEKGIEIIRGLRGHTTGYAVPTYVIDAPGGGGKIPLLPRYLVGRDGEDLLLKNYEGHIYRYPDPGGNLGSKSHSNRRGIQDTGKLMRIGITYDLREDYIAEGFSEEETAEFDRDETIQAIQQSLQDLGCETDRIGNIKNLTRRLGAGDRWDVVFNIAEGLRGFGREAQVPALLEAYNIPYTFSDPMVLSLTLHKGVAKRVVRDLGVPTPDFYVIEKESDVAKGDLPFPLLAKPVAEGTGKGINAASKTLNQSQLISVCTRLLTTYKQPVLIETFLPGREFTVGIIGSGTDATAIGVLEVILRENAEPDVYSYLNKERYEDSVEYLLANDAIAEKAKEVALAVWRGLGCRDAGRIDIRADANGTPNFMEVNPLAGLHPQHSDLCIIANMVDMSYRALIEAILHSAISRVHKDEYSLGFSACLGK